MYLRREAPQVQEQPTRLVLLDDGVRSWGVQRLYLFSAMLALVAEASEHAAHQAYRQTTDFLLRTIEWNDPELLLGEAGALAPHAHCGLGLVELAKRADQLGGLQELYVLTTPRVMEDPDFRLALRSVLAGHSLVAVVVSRRWDGGNYPALSGGEQPGSAGADRRARRCSRQWVSLRALRVRVDRGVATFPPSMRLIRFLYGVRCGFLTSSH